MPEESKFSGTLARLRKPQQAPTESVAPEPAQPAAQPPRRRPGKRSDPETWANITILMRKQVKKAVRRRLEDEGEGKDITTLIDELLTEWLAKRD
jgi:hypothetical protein